MDQMQQIYQEIILDHARMKHGHGSLSVSEDGKSFQVNPTCGDEITICLKISAQADEKWQVEQLAWQGEGCSISQASASIMHDLVLHQDLERVEEIFNYFHELMENRGKELTDEQKADALEDANAFVGAAKFPARIKCALLSWMAIKDAIAKAKTNVENQASSSERAIHCE